MVIISVPACAAVLPLTRNLSHLSGSVWNKTLAGQRAQRIEMLLLHEFHKRKFLLPDKMSQREKDRLAKVRRDPRYDPRPGTAASLHSH